MPIPPYVGVHITGWPGLEIFKIINNTMRKLSLTAVLLLAGTLLLPAAQTVNFGNFAPGRPFNGGFGLPISSTDFAAVKFTTGADAITIDSVDLGFTISGAATGFRLLLATADLLTGSTVLTFTNPNFTVGSEQRLRFFPDVALQLSANTPYWLRLEWDSSTGNIGWSDVFNTPDINSDYSSYSFRYGGSYESFPNQDLAAYYITATTIPEPSVAVYVLGGVLLAGLSTRFARQRQGSI